VLENLSLHSKQLGQEVLRYSNPDRIMTLSNLQGIGNGIRSGPPDTVLFVCGLIITAHLFLVHFLGRLGLFVFLFCSFSSFILLELLYVFAFLKQNID